LIYRGLTDDSIDSSDLRKVSAHNAMTHGGGTTGKQVCVMVSCSSVWIMFIAVQFKPT